MKQMEVVCRHRCTIGEGPVWNEFDNRLYFVNGFAGEICSLDLKTGELEIRKQEIGVAAMAFDRTGRMLVSRSDGAFYLNADNSTTPLYDARKYVIRNGNDAKVGPDGRFYIGTQSEKRLGISDQVNGRLYSIDKYGKVKVLLEGLILSNGMEWSVDEKFFYHTDSDTGFIREYHFNKAEGTLYYSGRQVRVPGVDGFTIDQTGVLHVACWGKGHVALVDTETMEVTGTISVPARIPASCGFAGEEMELLAVTTAAYDSNLATDQEAGFTYVIKTGSCGRKPYLFG